MILVGRDKIKDCEKIKAKVKKKKKKKSTQRNYIIQLDNLCPHDKILGAYIFYILSCIYNEL